MKKIISYTFILLSIGALAGYLFFNVYKQKSDISINIEKPSDADQIINDSLKFKIIAAGDSLTAGYDLPLADSYPKILEEKLLAAGESVEVINAGISGETTAGLLERAQFISDQKPDMLLITTGGNDAFRNLPLKNTRENIEKAIKIFKERVKAENIYLLQIESTANSGLDYRKEFNAIYEEITRSEKINLLPFVTREVFLDPNKMLPDAIHPNKTGYEFIVDKYIFPEIIKKIRI